MDLLIGFGGKSTMLVLFKIALEKVTKGDHSPSKPRIVRLTAYKRTETCRCMWTRSFCEDLLNKVTECVTAQFPFEP